jgi:hypothetical protein
MTDFGTLLLSIGTALFSLAVLSLVLWPALVALLEISKAGSVPCCGDYLRIAFCRSRCLPSFWREMGGGSCWRLSSRPLVRSHISVCGFKWLVSWDSQRHRELMMALPHQGAPIAPWEFTKFQPIRSGSG